MEAVLFIINEKNVHFQADTDTCKLLLTGMYFIVLI